MSESEQDASILGKRTRNGNDHLDEGVPDSAPPTNQEDEDDDDDGVGPMPMPAEAPVNGGSKKKRKGVYMAGTNPLGYKESDGLESFTS
jgi:peptidylprolyl isomerase domain and WD repeat-containing protein 1